MDKRIIFAVAGAGKTTYIVNNLSLTKRSLIVTYTNGNYNNLFKKICARFDGKWPNNITLMTYFSFLYRFCYKPFLADKVKAKGITFIKNENKFAKQTEDNYYLTKSNYFYSNRLSLFLEKKGVLEDIKERIETYFDEFIIDEVQDIAGRDFMFIEKIMESNINMLFVGDFYQHTFDTSRDGNINKNLFNNKREYENHFIAKGFLCDNTTLLNSWRCGRQVCKYITEALGIDIDSNRNDDNVGVYSITDQTEIDKILSDDSIIKLHYQKGAEHGNMHKNWGDTKGEDHYQSVCVMLNKTTADKFSKGKLKELAQSTKNKLYVAITRARGDVYFITE